MQADFRIAQYYRQQAAAIKPIQEMASAKRQQDVLRRRISFQQIRGREELKRQPGQPVDFGVLQEKRNTTNEENEETRLDE
jgi:hypothetical protein